MGSLRPSLLVLLLTSTGFALAPQIWTDAAKARAENPDFAIQGEYGFASTPPKASAK